MPLSAYYCSVLTILGILNIQLAGRQNPCLPGLNRCQTYAKRFLVNSLL